MKTRLMGTIVAIFTSISLVFAPISVLAQSSIQASRVVINELSTGMPGQATHEFVELYNRSEDSVDVTGWKLTYTSASGLTTTTLYTFPAQTVIYPDGYILLATTGYLPELSPKFEINAGLSSTGGTVTLVSQNSQIEDRVGWGSDERTLCEGEATIAPTAGQSIERLLNQDIPQDTNDNKVDFTLNVAPSPQVDNIAPEPEDVAPPPELPPTNPSIPPTEEPDIEEPLPQEDPPTPELPSVLLPLVLNELFIDPVSPLTDSANEYVEIYNPNTEQISLAGYVLYSGSNFTYSYSFTATEKIPANGYFVVTSGASNITLANSGGAAKLVDAVGKAVDEVTYQESKEGNAWARDNTGAWVWTTTPTEGAQNQISAPVLTAKALVTAAAVKANIKKPTTPKATKAATAKKAITKTTKVKAAQDTQNTSGLTAAPTPLPGWLLAILGVLAVIYMCYEYRFEVANKIYQFRANRAPRG